VKLKVEENKLDIIPFFFFLISESHLFGITAKLLFVSKRLNIQRVDISSLDLQTLYHG